MSDLDEKVRVTGDDLGNVIIVSENNPDWAYIRLEQVRTFINDRGFVTKKPISALLHGRVEDLLSFNWKNNQEISGKIIFIESLTPFNTKNPERDYKIAGETGILCKVDDKPIYRKTLYKLTTNSEDVGIAHTNSEQIKESNDVYIKNKKVNKIDKL